MDLAQKNQNASDFRIFGLKMIIKQSLKFEHGQIRHVC